MKKEQFRSMVKEIIKEVISEIDVNEGNRFDQYKSDKAYKARTDDLEKIKDEPDFKKKQKDLKVQHGDAPFDTDRVDENKKRK